MDQVDYTDKMYKYTLSFLQYYLLSFTNFSNPSDVLITNFLPNTNHSAKTTSTAKMLFESSLLSACAALITLASARSDPYTTGPVTGPGEPFKTYTSNDVSYVVYSTQGPNFIGPVTNARGTSGPSVEVLTNITPLYYTQSINPTAPGIATKSYPSPRTYTSGPATSLETFIYYGTETPKNPSLVLESGSAAAAKSSSAPAEATGDAPTMKKTTAAGVAIVAGVMAVLLI